LIASVDSKFVRYKPKDSHLRHIKKKTVFMAIILFYVHKKTWINKLSRFKKCVTFP